MLKKEPVAREREVAFARDFITYLTAINYIYTVEFILMKLIEEKKVSKHYTLG